MRKERVNEIFGVVFLLFGLFTIASLAFFEPRDLSFFSFPPNPQTLNPTGVIGAYLAFFLTVSFGLGSYLIPGLFLIWSWCFFTQRIPERKLFKFVGLAIGLVAISIFLGISFYPEKRFLRAGAVGYVLGSQILEYFGPMGSTIITGSCFLLALLLATDFLIYPLVKSFWESFSGFFERFTRRIHALTQWTEKLGTGLQKLKNRKPAAEERKKETKNETAFRAASKYSSPEEPEITPSKKALEPLPVAAPIIKEFVRPPAPKEREIPKETKEPKSEPALAREKPNADGTAYRLPGTDIFRKPLEAAVQTDDLRYNSRVVEETLSEFGIEAKIVEVEQGPVITRYELLPAPGVKVTRILSLGDDLALALKATSLRFIAPIPGKSAIGIEVPNSKIGAVFLRELLESSEFCTSKMALPLLIGKDTSGKPLLADLAEMPHLLIAGTTGSGKTVCVNSIIAGLLCHSTPDRLKFVMVDPKMVELAIYGTIPHMLSPVVTDPKKAAATLGWVVTEMENRYRLFANRGVRNIQSFNAQSEEALPYIVVVIDELADLMMVAQDKVESTITRLAQLSRAVGIHLILATQRPSVDVITGVIKANFPARISFKVASKVDSRTVLDLNGADKLLGKGDLLFLMPGEAKLIRGQGAFVVDEEINRVVEFVSKQRTPEFHPEIDCLQENKVSGVDQGKDELFEEAVRVVLETGVASASTLQRRLRLGYTRAARIVDQMEADRIVGPHNGSKPREILVDRAQTLREQTVPPQ